MHSLALLCHAAAKAGPIERRVPLEMLEVTLNCSRSYRSNRGGVTGLAIIQCGIVSLVTGLAIIQLGKATHDPPL